MWSGSIKVDGVEEVYVQSDSLSGVLSELQIYLVQYIRDVTKSIEVKVEKG